MATSDKEKRLFILKELLKIFQIEGFGISEEHGN